MPLSEVFEACSRRQLVAHELLGRKREQDLPSVGGGEKPCHPVDRRSEVVAVPLFGGARVQRHPHPKRTRRFPLLARECSLDRKGRFQGIGGGREGTTEGVADGLEDVAPRSWMRRCRISSWRARALCIACGWPSHILVEPSMSVNRKVTVPAGGPFIGCASPFPLRETTAAERATGPLFTEMPRRCVMRRSLAFGRAPLGHVVAAGRTAMG